MNAPKKIYYDPYVGTANRKWVVGDTTYIREDLVDELVEALKHIRDYEFSHRYIKDITKAALAKLEESHD